MEFLLGNPYSTPVGQCIEKGTDGSLQGEDWALNMEICDIINETEDGPKDALRAVKKRLNGNRNFREVMLALTVLETCVKNCGHRFHVLVANRDFIDGVLVKIISPKSNPPTIVQDKVLALIQAWADAFRSSPDLTGVVHIYEELKRKGIEFPMADLDALSPIHTPQRGVPEVDPALLKYRAPTVAQQPSVTSQPPPRAATPGQGSAATSPTHIPTIPSIQGPISANPEQVARLRSELDVVRGNAKVMSEMLTEMVPGHEEASDLELLQELNRTCRNMQHRIMELIARVANEEVTEELLHVNDDLNNIFLRYERYERYRSGRAAQKNGMLNEANEDNLIDLGPGSPAVVSPRPSGASHSSSPTPASPPHVAAAAAPLAPPPVVAAAAPPSAPPVVAAAAAATANAASPAALTTQLAGLDMGSGSVSGTLCSLSSGGAPPQQHDDFDMFAHTRGSSLAEQRKNMTYEDPQALGGLASALDIRQQNTAGLRDNDDSAQLEPIDSWLITQGMKGDKEEGVTSEEFDKFLEERAKVADTPLPCVPSEEPSPPISASSSSTGRRKAERTEDALFAL
ncbi:TOM1-like protein 2 isoform X2 [Clupea harengus]|uniref:TOM1-like protein 2 isoform X2 n=1 Tax=Clupea harengus TaxID=7950 RepID=A0A6P8FT10_CLUHA|nr:TOM1-like protein 2 isoform X2 [Clupea harengus]